MAKIRKWFMGVRGRLLVLIALPTAVLIIVVSTSIYAFLMQKHNLENIVNVRTPRLMLLSELGKNSHAIAQYVLQNFLEQNQQAERRQSLDEVTDLVAKFGKNLEEMKKYPSSEKFSALYEPSYDVWKKLEPELQDVLKRLRSESKADDALILTIISKKVTPLSDKIVSIFKACEKLLNENTEVLLKQTNESSTWLMTLIVVISLSGGILSISLGILFATRLVNGLTGLAEKLAHGADKVTTTSVQMNTSSESLSSSVTEQAAALQETAASIEEMSAMVTKNTENSAKSREISNQSHQSATQGKQVVGQMIQAIEDINVSNTQIMQEVENSNREISEIIKVIGEIGNKTKVINDIVFQTKLLSFNASVEAARAGEHGKGFAVVAEEVGNLAQMSGNAAREISTMLEGSIAKVESIVNNTKTKVERLIVNGKEKVYNGSEIAKRCGEVLDVIVTNVSTVNHMVEEISSASQEQDHGIKEITRAISQLDQVTQQNSVSCQESASAAAALSSEAETLRDTIQNLNIAVEGEASSRGTERAHAVKVGLMDPPKKNSAKSPEKSQNKIQDKFQEKSSLPKEHSRKVIPISKGAKVPASGVTHVEKERTGKPFKATSASVASGTAISVPSENDPRFEDV